MPLITFGAPRLNAKKFPSDKSLYAPKASFSAKPNRLQADHVDFSAKAQPDWQPPQSEEAKAKLSQEVQEALKAAIDSETAGTAENVKLARRLTAVMTAFNCSAIQWARILLPEGEQQQRINKSITLYKLMRKNISSTITWPTLQEVWTPFEAYLPASTLIQGLPKLEEQEQAALYQAKMADYLLEGTGDLNPLIEALQAAKNKPAFKLAIGPLLKAVRLALYPDHASYNSELLAFLHQHHPDSRSNTKEGVTITISHIEGGTASAPAIDRAIAFFTQKVTTDQFPRVEVLFKTVESTWSALKEEIEDAQTRATQGSTREQETRKTNWKLEVMALKEVIKIQSKSFAEAVAEIEERNQPFGIPLGQRVTLLRNGLDFSQHALAEAIGYNNASISYFETSSQKRSPEMYCQLVNYFSRQYKASPENIQNFLLTGADPNDAATFPAAYTVHQVVEKMKQTTSWEHFVPAWQSLASPKARWEALIQAGLKEHECSTDLIRLLKLSDDSIYFDPQKGMAGTGQIMTVLETLSRRFSKTFKSEITPETLLEQWFKPSTESQYFDDATQAVHTALQNELTERRKQDKLLLWLKEPHSTPRPEIYTHQGQLLQQCIALIGRVYHQACTQVSITEKVGVSLSGFKAYLQGKDSSPPKVLEKAIPVLNDWITKGNARLAEDRLAALTAPADLLAAKAALDEAKKNNRNPEAKGPKVDIGPLQEGVAICRRLLELPIPPDMPPLSLEMFKGLPDKK
jgi:transcriptional regulator with XRE-family HTH domain